MVNTDEDALAGCQDRSIRYQHHNHTCHRSNRNQSRKKTLFCNSSRLCYTLLMHPFPATHLISIMPLLYKSSSTGRSLQVQSESGHKPPPSGHPIPTPAKNTKQATQKERAQRAASQKVICPAARGPGHRALVVWHGGEDRELGVEVLPQVHDARDITAAVAVIRRRPDGHDRLVAEVPLPSLLVRNTT